MLGGPIALLATGPILAALQGAVLGVASGGLLGALAGLAFWWDEPELEGELRTRRSPRRCDGRRRARARGASGTAGCRRHAHLRLSLEVKGMDMMKTMILDELVDAARSGDRVRFDRLFDLWFAAVYALTLRRVSGDRLRAENLTRRLLIACVRAALTAGSVVAADDESTKEPRANALAR